jgi:N-acetylmuramoyl-L-alanine amidase
MYSEPFIICLDPGHGGHDPGAVNRSENVEEAPMALDVCLRARELFIKAGCDVVMTRTDDTFVSLSDRPRIANNANANVFVSYHFNSASDPNTKSSYEGFTTRGQNRSDKLATCILKRHGVAFPEQSLRADNSDGDIDKEANFAVLRGTDHPAFLMEGEFIHTKHGAAFIKNPDNRQKMAQAVFDGVMDYKKENF